MLLYNIIKNVITEGTYELSDMLKKIDTCWIKSQITDEEKYELIKLAQENADPTMTTDIWKKLEELDRRMIFIEKKLDTKLNPDEYPEYVVGKWYYKGDKITFESEKYICIAPEGYVCTWSPIEYPTYWKKITE